MLQGQKKINSFEVNEKAMGIVLLGASFDTGNLGVSALADVSMKLLHDKWPNSKVYFVGLGVEPEEEDLTFGKDKKQIINIPVRYSKNIFHECHFFRFLFYGIAKKLGFKNIGNKHFNIINNCDLVCDITAGDSFSDIYGFKRFFLGFLTKRLFVFWGKELIMLPQTYGPFKKKITKKMAAYILKKAKAVYSRDKKGIDCIGKLLKGQNVQKVKLCPDIAFLLDAEPWDDRAVEQVIAAKDRGRQIVGLNISGLLYNGGYTRDNMFGLALDYPKLIKQILDCFLNINDVTFVLVPHVFPKDELSVESDPAACKAIYDCLTKEQQESVILPEKEPNQRQIKYLIGQCDFFVGARMHSCIAALSQCIPTVGMAYSDKFAGVFETINISDCVVDMRCFNNIELLEQIKNILNKSIIFKNELDETIPQIKGDIFSLFNDIQK